MGSRGGSFSWKWKLLAAASSALRRSPVPLAYRRSPSLEAAIPGTEEGLSWLAKVTGATKGIQTKAEPSAIVEEVAKDHKIQLNVTGEDSSSEGTLHRVGEESNVKYTAVSRLKMSSRHDLAMIFTCKVCETRSVRTASRESYEKGIVVARCGGCNNLHLIADRLGWFGEPGSIEEFLAARGEEVKKGSADTLNLTLEDLAGTKSS
ncbi:hypothetical protein Taro_020574 [Colocasia esculenta]|uniref:DNL-type domain-containing protein n=1 Tax=Colocasia esculenta TaxID=4460 RepID=A0A843UWN2_COLES|nr:hypothetical protein [Colocasia esculenta]